MLRDDFNREKPMNDNWLEVYGGQLTKKCGTLVSGNSLTFTDVSCCLSILSILNILKLLIIFRENFRICTD
jgi:hypothetical protein